MLYIIVIYKFQTLVFLILMALAAQVKEVFFRERQENEATLQQISEKYHIPQSHVANLLNGKRSFGGITLDTFDRMFPLANVYLDGVGCHQSIGNNSNGNIQQVGVGHNASADTATLRMALVDAICDLDLSPEDQARVIQTIRMIMQRK